eukprot:6915851-Lingulodinium_polyedra.AAC.1
MVALRVGASAVRALPAGQKFWASAVRERKRKRRAHLLPGAKTQMNNLIAKATAHALVPARRE